MSERGKRFGWVLILPAWIALSACGGAADSSDPDRMAREDPPEHNPEATYRGQTAQEYAQQLEDRSRAEQLRALAALEAMGVDGLPARPAVRDFIGRIDSFGLDPIVAEHLEVQALSALAGMQAPEALALVRQRLVAPDFSSRIDNYRDLIDLAAGLGVEDQTLIDDMLLLADSAPEHAGLLLRTGSLPGPVREALGQALFVAEHDEVMARYFLAHLAEFDFLEQAQALAYVETHIDLAREDIRAIHATLVGIGSEAALDLALAVSESEFGEENRLVSRFARSQMGPERAMERLLEAAMESDGRQSMDRFVDGIAVITRDLAHAANNDEPGAMELESVQQLHVDTLTILIEQGPLPDHRITGAQRLLRYVQLNQDVALSAVLDPVFELAGSPDQTFETRMAVQQFLGRTFATLPARDPEYLFGKAVEMLWAGDDAETTEIPASMLNYARRAPEHAEIVIANLQASMADHLDQWTVNPAAAVALNVASISQLDRRSAREQGSMVVGELIASPAAELEYLEAHLMRRMNTMADFSNNTVAGMAGLVGPTIFAEHEAMHRQFHPAAFAEILQVRPGWFRDEPDSVAEWKRFLTRVVEARVEHFSASAQSALEALD